MHPGHARESLGLDGFPRDLFPLASKPPEPPSNIRLPGGITLLFGLSQLPLLMKYLEVKDEAEVERYAGQLLKALNQPFEWEEKLIRIRASIGIVEFKRGVGDAALLLHQADEAMYLAKTAGKGQWLVVSGRPASSASSCRVG